MMTTYPILMLKLFLLLPRIRMDTDISFRRKRASVQSRKRTAFFGTLPTHRKTPLADRAPKSLTGNTKKMLLPLHITVEKLWQCVRHVKTIEAPLWDSRSCQWRSNWSMLAISGRCFNMIASRLTNSSQATWIWKWYYPSSLQNKCGHPHILTRRGLYYWMGLVCGNILWHFLFRRLLELRNSNDICRTPDHHARSYIYTWEGDRTKQRFGTNTCFSAAEDGINWRREPCEG